MRKLIAICLIVCICLSSMAMFASAVETRSTWVAICQSDSVNFRSTPNEKVTFNIIGLLMNGDKLHTSSGVYEEWFYGIPDPATAIYQAFGEVDGYAKANFFRVW